MLFLGWRALPAAPPTGLYSAVVARRRIGRQRQSQPYMAAGIARITRSLKKHAHTILLDIIADQ